jgi:hypothetical protein
METTLKCNELCIGLKVTRRALKVKNSAGEKIDKL